MIRANLSVMTGMVIFMGAASALAETDPGSVKLGGGIVFTPSLSAGIMNDDNVTYSDTDQIESVVALVSPNFLLSADNGVSTYGLSYTLTKGEYFDSDEDNYLDHALRGEANWELNARNRVGLSGSYTNGHEARGTGFSQGSGGSLDEPDTYTDDDIHGIYSFGAETAKGRIDLTAGSRERDYDGGLRTRDRDRSTDYGTVEFFYNAGGKTELLAEVTRRNIDYIYTDTETLDSTETDLLVGITWEGTAKTSGTIKVGSLQKKFDSPIRENSTSPRWEVSVRWLPRTYSAFDLLTERSSEETNGVGNFIDTQRYTLSWTHSWKERLSTELSFSHSNLKYDSSDRKDNLDSSSLTVNYQMRRWLALSAGVDISNRDANLNGFDYDKNLTFIGIQASL